MKKLAGVLLAAALCGCAAQSSNGQPGSSAAKAETLATFQPGPGSSPPSAAPAPAGIAFQGGDGSSIEKAIVIAGARGEEDGVNAEYSWLSGHYPGYSMRTQALLKINDKYYDRLDFTTAQGEAKSVYFDISGFFGK